MNKDIETCKKIRGLFEEWFIIWCDSIQRNIAKQGWEVGLGQR